MVIYVEKSIWEDYTNLNKFNKLQNNIKTNVLVIGAGISGILCGYELKKRGIDYVIVEQNRVASGITKNTTAFITAQHEMLYQDLIKDLGYSKAKEYLDLNLNAVEKYKELGKIYDIDLEIVPSCLFTTSNFDKIIKEKEALHSLGYSADIINKLPNDLVNKPVKGILFNNQAVINPLKLIKSLSNELTIYEDTKIYKLTKNKAYTKEYTISFNYVIVATHFPFINRNGLYFMKMKQRRSYVGCIPFKNIKGTYCSIDEDGMYFRSYKDYLLIGGNDRDTNHICKNKFKEQLESYFKTKNIKYYYSNQDCTTIDNIPYIGRYDLYHDNWYVVTGFNLWGFTWAMVASNIIVDMILGRDANFLVDPNRNFIKKQLFKNIFNSTKNLISFKTPRCSHLGCKLNFNKIEKTWECPCHGSRYDGDGTLINGPSQKDIKITCK